MVAARKPVARNWHSNGLSEFDRSCIRRVPSDLASAVAQRLSFLARSRICDWRSVGGFDCRLLWFCVSNTCDCCTYLLLGWNCGRTNVRTVTLGASNLLHQERSSPGAPSGYACFILVP